MGVVSRVHEALPTAQGFPAFPFQKEGEGWAEGHKKRPRPSALPCWDPTLLWREGEPPRVHVGRCGLWEAVPLDLVSRPPALPQRLSAALPSGQPGPREAGSPSPGPPASGAEWGPVHESVERAGRGGPHSPFPPVLLLPCSVRCSSARPQLWPSLEGPGGSPRALGPCQVRTRTGAAHVTGSGLAWQRPGAAQRAGLGAAGSVPLPGTQPLSPAGASGPPTNQFPGREQHGARPGRE